MLNFKIRGLSTHCSKLNHCMVIQIDVRSGMDFLGDTYYSHHSKMHIIAYNLHINSLNTLYLWHL